MSLPPRSPLEPGYRIGRYELLYALASGGMGQVWVARLQGNHGFEKLFAIKTILDEKAADPRFRQMFLDEARIASAIEHPNVAQIIDLGEQDSVLFLMMEFVDGDSVHKLHRACEREGKLIPQAVVLRILADACLGLHAAHGLTDREGRRLEVVHRDVSPQNILVGANGVAKLIDFGVAKARDRLGGETISGSLKGKVRYMSPEQASGHPVDGRADVWGAGAVLYHLLQGEAPHRGDEIQILRALLGAAPVVPIGGHVPPPVAAVVARALANNPAERFATANDLSMAIEHAMYATGRICTTASVASFYAAALGDRIAARRDTLRIALRAVTDHTEARTMLHEPLSTEPSQPSGLPAVRTRKSDEPTLSMNAIRQPAIPPGASPSDYSLASMNSSIAGVPRAGHVRRTVVIAALVVVGIASAGLMGATLAHRFARVTPPEVSPASPRESADTPPTPSKVLAVTDPAPVADASAATASALVDTPLSTSVAPHSAPQIATTATAKSTHAPSTAPARPPRSSPPPEDDLGSALDTRH